MELTLAKIVLLASISYVVWRLVRPVVTKSSLSNVRGPKPESWLKGSSSAAGVGEKSTYITCQTYPFESYKVISINSSIGMGGSSTSKFYGNMVEW